MFLIDSHCHLDKLNYITLHKNIDDVIKKAQKKNINIILFVCTEIKNFNFMKKLVKGKKNIFLSYGTHPLYIDKYFNFKLLNSISFNKKIIAIGETGLDFYKNKHNKKRQKKAFRNHIEISKNYKKPLIIHSRNSIKDVLSILKEKESNNCNGVLHCFSESIESARILLNLGFYISFSGIITFNPNAFKEIIKFIPLNRILIETDSPYLSPVPYKNKENQPSYMIYIANILSKIKNISLEELSNHTSKNFCKLFKININKY
ncbi:TatD family hydrolase [Sodalis-like secondary symbiont of Drepanosiphum platanoidis]|uniref:TatD family hydrolase n=1 Tax=Sodalis-like secondary symbiont of Drepanosiphum platanoidis TaxID=2994493 RepID=UPI00346458C7